MKSREEDIMNELEDIDYEDDSLTLLDDEELQSISEATVEVDTDLASFYAEEPLKPIEAPKKKEKEKEETPKAVKPKKIEEPIEEIIEEEPEVPVIEEVPEVIETPKELPAIQEEKFEPKMPDIEPAKMTSMKELDQLFNKVTSNVQGAADRVNRHVDIKNKIDEKIVELQNLQEAHEKNKQRDIDEINNYKDEVYAKLKAKKEEIEAQIEDLKNQKQNFEVEKQVALDGFVRKEKELNDSYDNRVKGLEQIENSLVRRKEQLDIERFEISKEREKCEVDKKELAEQLAQFNQLVDDFTKGVDRFSD